MEIIKTRMSIMIILDRRTKTEALFALFNAKNFLIGMMVATFLVFASGTSSIKEGEEFLTILTGAGLFTVAAGLLIWAKDISRKLLG